MGRIIGDIRIGAGGGGRYVQTMANSTGALINYIELPAPELDATKAFYAAAFGWSFVEYGPTYAAATTDRVEVGLNQLGTVAPAPDRGAEDGIGPLVLFGSDDIVASEAAVRAAGGDISSPIYTYPGGRRLHFVDPSGNTLGIYQSDTA